MLQVFRLEKPQNNGRVSPDPKPAMPRVVRNAPDKSVDVHDKSAEDDVTGIRLSQGRGSVEVF